MSIWHFGMEAACASNVLRLRAQSASSFPLSPPFCRGDLDGVFQEATERIDEAHLLGRQAPWRAERWIADEDRERLRATDRDVEAVEELEARGRSSPVLDVSE